MRWGSILESSRNSGHQETITFSVGLSTRQAGRGHVFRKLGPGSSQLLGSQSARYLMVVKPCDRTHGMLSMSGLFILIKLVNCLEIPRLTSSRKPFWTTPSSVCLGFPPPSTQTGIRLHASAHPLRTGAMNGLASGVPGENNSLFGGHSVYRESQVERPNCRQIQIF